jgi:hypothetical protein
MAIPAIVAGMACYQYRDTRLTDVRPSETVHVVLSADASASLASTIGPNATSIDGRVLAVDARTMRVAVSQIARAVGPEEFLRDEPIDLPTAGALSISTRSADPVRTVLAIGGVIAGAFAAHAVSNQPGIVTVKGGPIAGTK